eukprot:Nitzschia sp. Nitz4//scaffold384_size14786//6076//10073//NITZ4_008916-RA/size14786-snap-gene-0.0-mRNA-1//1//CDS//3329549943//247//frame0
MEPALDVIHRALHGDEGARSFLDQTSSIYVLDATEPSNPRTYGCWNFIHRGLNEVERAEGTARPGQEQQQSMTRPRLVAYVQLLATMALRVARRSNALDKQLVATCIQNASQCNVPPQEAQRLIDINVEIRDIVMGRLAALALDPSHLRSGSSDSVPSAFADVVVLETFCAVLAANAVSNGPSSIKHLVTEWIVPSSSTLPPFCLSCISLHLAEEASRRTAPVGSYDALQQLSSVVMAAVVAPVLAESVKESNSEDEKAKTTAMSNGLSLQEFNSRVVVLCLQAMKQWCNVTDLSLPQIKHICGKVNINIVDILSDAMYSSSPPVVDALAEFIEVTLQHDRTSKVSSKRMAQTRYIMQVDEASFRANVSPDHLLTIELKELAPIVEEIMSAVGLQRFRFVERQERGDVEVCRNLTRISALICDACVSVRLAGQCLPPSPGVLDLLFKATCHPSHDVCAIALDAFTNVLPTEPTVVSRLLPILQGRAIVPHQFVNGTIPSILPTESTSFEGFLEFDSFRYTALAEVLRACWRVQPEAYYVSCTAAVEEFCGSGASVTLSFHLEAALFCIGVVAQEVGTLPVETEKDVQKHVSKCLAALAVKPKSLLCNPLTLVSVCRFVGKYVGFLAKNPDKQLLDTCADLALVTFNLCGTDFSEQQAAVEMKREGDISPYSDAADALQKILDLVPSNFLSTEAIAALGAGWEASYAAANRPGVLTLEDRRKLCHGICQVLGRMPESQRAKSLMALAMPSLDCLETMLSNAALQTGPEEQRDLVLDRIASEIVMVATMYRSFSDSCDAANSRMESGCHTSDAKPSVVEPAVSLLQRAWSSVTLVVSRYFFTESISNALSYFVCKSLPQNCEQEVSLKLVQEMCELTHSIVKGRQSKEDWSILPVYDFLTAFVDKYKSYINKYACADGNSSQKGGDGTVSESEITQITGSCLEKLLLASIVDGHVATGVHQSQGNGESASESQSQLQKSPIAIAGSIFSVFKCCADQCPFFLLTLSENGELLVHHLVSAAIASIVELDMVTSLKAMEFLNSMLVFFLHPEKLQSLPNKAKSVLSKGQEAFEQVLTRSRAQLVTVLLVGCCGKVGSSSQLQVMVILLVSVLRTYASNPEEGFATLRERGLHEGHFLLGPHAREVIIGHLLRACTSPQESGDVDPILMEMLDEVRRLHQVDNPDALVSSDAVASFCLKYGTS